MMKMNENNCNLVPDERLVEIRNYFLADGMRDALVYRLEAKRSVVSDTTEIDNAIKVVDRRYDELLTEYENGSQTVILH